MPTGSPASTGAASGAAVSTTGMPNPVAIRAASTFVTMPPVPTPARPAPPMSTPVRSRSSCTSLIRLEPGRVGSPVQRASTSERSTSRSAWTRAATRAANRSLSPKRISSVATVSFSLTIGTARRSSSLRSVRYALR